jgi:hypothetical protein
MDRADVYETTRALWQETFDAMHAGMDEMAKCGTTMVSNFANACTTTVDATNGAARTTARKPRTTR